MGRGMGDDGGIERRNIVCYCLQHPGEQGWEYNDTYQGEEDGRRGQVQAELWCA